MNLCLFVSFYLKHIKILRHWASCEDFSNKVSRQEAGKLAHQCVLARDFATLTLKVLKWTTVSPEFDIYRVCTGLKSTLIYRIVLKSPLNLSLP